MKALEKAAQDRDKTPAAPPHPSAPPPPPHPLQHEYTATPELTLEPVALKPGIKRDENTSRVPMIPKRAAASPADTHPAQARAATVLNAHHTRSDDAAPSRVAGIMAQLAARPVYAISALAALFLLIYAGYVYVQIAHPRLLIKSPVSPQRAPPPAVATTATTTAPPSEPLSGGTPQATDATSASFATLQSVFGGRTDLPAASAALPTSSSSSTLPRESSGSIPPQPTRPALSPCIASAT